MAANRQPRGLRFMNTPSSYLQRRQEWSTCTKYDATGTEKSGLAALEGPEQLKSSVSHAVRPLRNRI
jgi:hypothetical protein